MSRSCVIFCIRFLPIYKILVFLSWDAQLQNTWIMTPRKYSLGVFARLHEVLWRNRRRHGHLNDGNCMFVNQIVDFKHRPQDILGFEADKRAITITVNSLGTELSRNDRGSLFPELGSLYPDGHRDLVSCNDFVQVQATMEMYLSYEGLGTGLIQTNDKPLEKVWSCLSS